MPLGIFLVQKLSLYRFRQAYILFCSIQLPYSISHFALHKIPNTILGPGLPPKRLPQVFKHISLFFLQKTEGGTTLPALTTRNTRKTIKRVVFNIIILLLWKKMQNHVTKIEIIYMSVAKGKPVFSHMRIRSQEILICICTGRETATDRWINKL